MLDVCYRLLTMIGRPPLRGLLARRLALGKEDPLRWSERQGKAGLPRPSGTLLWCHAASVGESLSLLALISRLQALTPRPTILVTTGTLSSAKLLAERLPEIGNRAGIIHQYVPIDRPSWVKRFLDHWRPDMAIWIESELWPNLLAEVHTRKIPVVLLNGRMSKGSHRRWMFAKKWAAKLLSPFVLVLTQTEAEARRFRGLGAWPVACLGNLKCAANPLPVNETARAALQAAIKRRPAWLFASTHTGEEEIALLIHRRLAARHPGLLTVIAPRHPRRAQDIKSLLRARGLSFATRSSGELPRHDHSVYLADTMGELGVLYSVLPIAVIGASFVPIGGHNPIEAAQLGAAIIFGPHMHKATGIRDSLLAAGGAIQVKGEAGLADQLDDLLRHPAKLARQAEAARAVIRKDAATLDRIMALLAPLLRTIGLQPPAIPLAEEESETEIDTDDDYPAQMGA